MSSAADTIRANFVLPRELRDEAQAVARAQGMTLAEFLRDSLRSRLEELHRRDFEQRMIQAYQGLAEENRQLAEDFRAVDLAEWEGVGQE
jgi:hypothetical protein